MQPLNLRIKNNTGEWSIYQDPVTKLYYGKNKSNAFLTSRYTTRKAAEQALEMYLRRVETPTMPRSGRKTPEEIVLYNRSAERDKEGNLIGNHKLPEPEPEPEPIKRPRGRPRKYPLPENR